MIGDLIEQIREAEARAAKIVADAQNKATAMENAATAEIEALKNTTMNNIAKKHRPVHTKHTAPHIAEITVAADRLAAAKKYIAAEFHKRYGA